MSTLSDLFENEIINYFLRNQAITFTRGSLHIALSTADYVDTATGTSMNELTGTGYARQPVSFDAPVTAGVTQNTAAVVFTAGGTWPEARAIYIVDHATPASSKVLGGATITPATLASGDSLTFAIGDIDFTLT